MKNLDYGNSIYDGTVVYPSNTWTNILEMTTRALCFASKFAIQTINIFTNRIGWIRVEIIPPGDTNPYVLCQLGTKGQNLSKRYIMSTDDLVSNDNKSVMIRGKMPPCIAMNIMTRFSGSTNSGRFTFISFHTKNN